MGNKSISRSFTLGEPPLQLLTFEELDYLHVKVEKVAFSFGTIPQQTVANEDDFVTETNGPTLKLLENAEVD